MSGLAAVARPPDSRAREWKALLVLCAAARDRKQQRGELSLPHAGAPVAEGTVDDKAAPVRAAGAGALATSRTRSRGQARERPMKE